MKATIDAVQEVRRGEEILLTVTVHAPLSRTHIYRVSLERYAAAGSPSAGDAFSLEELAPLLGDEDDRLAYTRALKILAAGDNTKRNLVRKLTERGFLRESAERAALRLEGEGYIREAELLDRQLGIYAKRLWGPKKFMPNLIEKGFTRADIESAILRAKESGVYDVDAIKAEILGDLSEGDTATRRARLYKYGF